MLVLASGSKARHQLLKKAKIPHTVIISNFNESSVKENEPKKLVQQLSFHKASKVASELISSIKTKHIPPRNDKIILGCDSVFEFDGQVLGKPKNETEAIDRLTSMSSKNGILHTGHTMLFIDLKRHKKESHNITSIISWDSYVINGR